MRMILGLASADGRGRSPSTASGRPTESPQVRVRGAVPYRKPVWRLPSAAADEAHADRSGRAEGDEPVGPRHSGADQV